MNWNVRVITAPSRDTDLSLMVIFDQDKYLINCGEGTQRSCTQRGVGFRKLGTVLLTNSSSDVIGGLPGILMSSADTGIPEIKIAGPEAALQYLVSSRTFCQR
jgi:ribonuclease Z